ncbi:MAG: type II secretion system F family protein [Defluviitaleaceae bacterium]|nr:type II secretion system F family protein [Defluviitaleaceae bacterium]
MESTGVAPYDRSTLAVVWRILIGIAAYLAAVGVFWLFYRHIFIAVVFALPVFPAAVNISISHTKAARLKKLLGQFQSMLESLTVSLQAGNTELTAFENAHEDMKLMYSEESDIAKETQQIVAKFNHGISIGEALTDFANRSGLEDIKLFAMIFMSVEGKGDKAREIVTRTQKVLSDKISIQAEIKTLSSGAVMEINVMVFIPILIVAVMGFMGGELMEGLFTFGGRIASTVAILMFIGAYFLGKKIADIKV